jgi:LTXXQ motif family protein
MRVLRSFVIASALFAAVPAFGQSPQDHEAHHPDGGAGAQTPAPAQPARPQAGTAGPGMMSQSMMGQGMMGSGMGRGMMGGNMTSQSGGMMMNMIMRGQSGVERIEGRLAFIKAELKIGEAQASQWNAFADAMRKNAGAMAEMRNTMMSQQNGAGTLPERLALEDKAITAHLAALRKTAEAVGNLYKVLNDEQKKSADSIIVGPMGMPMGMM